MAEIGMDIKRTIDLLRAGEVVGMPTETVYGLAGNALAEASILKIYEVKNRPKFDPLIAHVASWTMVEKLAASIPEKARLLAETFWPGPLTLLLPKSKQVPDLLTSGLSRVAVRMPSHPLAYQLLSQLDFPLAAPSANPFGMVSPTSAEHVNEQLGNRIPYILDGGPCHIGLESTVVGFEENRVIVHRLGGLALEELESVIGTVEVALNKSSNPDAPGMLKKHYSPGKPVMIGDIRQLIAENAGKKTGVISFYEDFGVDNQIVLAPSGELSDAAKGIFSALRTFKNSDVELIISQKFPEEGLGRAINDRLQRASVQ